MNRKVTFSHHEDAQAFFDMDVSVECLFRRMNSWDAIKYAMQAVRDGLNDVATDDLDLGMHARLSRVRDCLSNAIRLAESADSAKPNPVTAPGPKSQKTADLRDDFAGRAMATMCAGPGATMGAERDQRYDGESGWAEIVASNAYAMADAMLVQRSKGGAS